MIEPATISAVKPTYYRTAIPKDQSVDTATTDHPHFAQHGLDEFMWLARQDPVRLAHLALHELTSDPVLLSQAAAAMATAAEENLMTNVLLKLTEHPRPFVREAALHGLVRFFGSSVDARDRAREMAAGDASPGVREAASEALLLF